VSYKSRNTTLFLEAQAFPHQFITHKGRITKQIHMNNGWIKLHRKFLDSEIWVTKPELWRIIWIYILLNVAHKTNGKLKKGVGYFNFTQDRKLIGGAITPDVVKKCLGYLRKSEMIRTTKSTRGMYIEVLNYATYQENDETEAPVQHYRSTTEAPQKHHYITRM
jgi:hypothetical protein